MRATSPEGLDGAQEIAPISARMPWQPTDPEAVELEEQMLAEWEDTVAGYVLDGWTATDWATVASETTGTYIKQVFLRRPRLPSAAVTSPEDGKG